MTDEPQATKPAPLRTALEQALEYRARAAAGAHYVKLVAAVRDAIQTFYQESGVDPGRTPLYDGEGWKEISIAMDYFRSYRVSATDFCPDHKATRAALQVERRRQANSVLERFGELANVSDLVAEVREIQAQLGMERPEEEREG